MTAKGLRMGALALAAMAGLTLFGWTGSAEAVHQEQWIDVNLLARVVSGEARGEPFEGKVAVAAVLLNRIHDPRFPNTLAGVVYQPYAFESVSNGQIWRPIDPESIDAAWAAISEWDPSYGAVFFWNPSKPVNPWIWSRPIVRWIGNHVFAL